MTHRFFVRRLTTLFLFMLALGPGREGWTAGLSRPAIEVYGTTQPLVTGWVHRPEVTIALVSGDTSATQLEVAATEVSVATSVTVGLDRTLPPMPTGVRNLSGEFTLDGLAPAQAPAKHRSAHVWPFDRNKATWTNQQQIFVALSDVDTSADLVEIAEAPDFTGSVTRNARTDDRAEYIRELYGYPRQFTPDGQFVATISWANTAVLLKADTYEVARQFGATGVQEIALTPDGHGLLTSGASQDAKLWDMQTGNLLRTISTGLGQQVIRKAAISPDGRWAVLSPNQGNATIYDLTIGQQVRDLDAPQAYGLAFVPATGQLLTGAANGLRLWDPATGALVRDFASPGGQLNAVAVSPDGQTVLTGGADTVIRLWSLVTGQEVRSYAGHVQIVTGLAFNPGGDRFASGGVSGELFTWDTERGTRLRTLYSGGHNYINIVYTPDGSHLLADRLVFLSDANYAFTLAAQPQGARTLYARLRNAAGASEPTSATIGFDTIPPPAPPAPRIPASGYTFDTQFTITWDPVEDPQPGSGIRAYRMIATTIPNYGPSTIQDLMLDPATHQATIVGPSGKTVYCVVYAIDQVGNAGPLSDISDGMNLASPDPPQLGGVDVRWADPATTGWNATRRVNLTLQQVGGSPVWVDVDEDDAFTSPSVYDYRKLYNYALDNHELRPGPEGKRTLYVRLRNYSGVSATVTTSLLLDTTPPPRLAAPTALDGTPTLNPIRFSWLDPSDTGIGVAGCECEVTTDTRSGGVTLRRNTGMATRMALLGEPGLTYYARVRANDRLGNAGEWSEWSAGVTVKVNPPTLDGIELPGADDQPADWTSTRSLEVKLKKVGFSPEFIEMAEDAALTSATIIPFTDANWSYRKSLPVNVGATCACVNAVAVSPDGRWLLAGMNSRAPALWDLKAGRLVRKFTETQSSSINAVTFSPDGRQALTCANDNQARLWDVGSGALLHTFPPSPDISSFREMRAVAFSPDGAYALIGNGFEACLWRLSDYSQAHIFGGHTHMVSAVGFNDDGSFLFTASLDGSVRVWRTKSGELLRTITKPGQVSDAEITPDGKALLTAHDCDLDLWDTRTGAFVGTLWQAGAGTYSRALLLTADGTRVAWLDNTAAHRYYWWDLLSGHLTQSFPSRNLVCQTALSPDEATMVAGDDKGYVSLYRFSCRYTLREGPDGPRTVYLRLRNAAGESRLTSATIRLDTTPPTLPGTPVGQSGAEGANPVRFAWSPGTDAGIGIEHYDVELGTAPGTADLFAGPRNTPEIILHVPVGKPVYARARAVDGVGQVSAWSDWSAPVTARMPGVEVRALDQPTTTTWVNSREVLLTLRRTILPPEAVEVDADAGFTSPVQLGVGQLAQVPLRADPTSYSINNVTSLAFSPDGGRLACAYSDGILRVRDTASWAETLAIKADPSTSTAYAHLRAAAFSPDGRSLLTAGLDSRLRQWDAATGTLLRTLQGHTPTYYGILDLAVSSDGRLAATGACDNTARLWDLESSASLRTITDHTNYVNSVAISPDGRMLATAGIDKCIMLWDVATGGQLRLIDQSSDTSSFWLYGLVFSPDGASLACSLSNKYAGLWDVKGGRQLVQYNGHERQVMGTSISADGSLLLTSSLDGTARLWNAQTGRLLRTFTGLTNVMQAELSPDGQTAALGKPLQLQDIRATYKVTLPEGDDGLREVWVRVPGGADGTCVTSTTIRLDRAAPVALGRPTADAPVLMNPIRFQWAAAIDPEPASGVASYDCEVKGADPGWAENLQSYHTNDPGLTVTWRCWGESIVCRARAVDVAGNVGPWSEWSEPVTVAAEKPPTLTGAAVYGLGERIPGMATTDTLRVALEGVGNGPLWVEIGEQPDLSDAVRFPAGECCDPAPLVLHGRIGPIWSMILSPDGRLMATADTGGVTVWDTWSGKPVNSINPQGTGFPSTNGHGFSPDGRRFVFLKDTRFMVVFNVPEWRDEYTIDLGEVSSLAFMPDGRQVVIASWSGRIRFFDLASGQVVRSIQSPEHLASSSNYLPELDVSADGARLLTSYYKQDPNDYNKSLYDAALWDVATGKVLRTFKTFEKQVYQVRLTPDGRFILATGYDDKWAVRQELWDAQTGQIVSQVPGALGGPVSGNGRTELMYLYGQQQARLLDVPNGGWLRGYRLPLKGLTRMALSDNGSLAVGQFTPDYKDSLQNAAILWDTRLAYRYALRSATPGPRTLYVRAGNLAGASAIVQARFTLAARPMSDRQSAILACLLGLAPESAATDSNGDGRIDVADLVAETRPVLDLPGFTTQQAVRAGETLTVAWSRNNQAGTAMRVELWLGGEKQAALGDIFSDAYHGEAQFKIPQLPSGAGYRLRLISYWLESHPGSSPAWVEAPGELTIAP